MEYIDLGRQYERVREEMDARMQKVVRERHFIMGPEVQELEEALAKYVGRKYCLACSNGTSALYLPLRAYGLTEKDAVFVSSYTYFASAEMISLAGATPVFIDSDETYNLDLDHLEKMIQKTLEEGQLRPRGILPVDLFGVMPDYERLQEIADRYDLFILADCAQSFGAERDGKKACAFGDVATTSFFPAKPLGCYGDGGAIFTDDDELYAIMHSLRVHGHGDSKYENVRIGINARLDTLQAAVLLTKLPILDDELETKRELAAYYDERLKNHFEIPVVPEGCKSALAQYTIQAKDEEERTYLMDALKKEGIPTMIYYIRPMHMQEAYVDLGYAEEDLPVCAAYSHRVFSLPMHAYMTEEEKTKVCDTLIRLVEEYRQAR